MPSRLTLCLLSAAVSANVTYWCIANRNQAVAARKGYWLDHCASLFELTGDCYTNPFDHAGNLARARLHHLRDEARAARNAVFPPLRYEPIVDGAQRQSRETPTCDDAYVSLHKIGPACAQFAWSALYKPERYEMDAPFEALFPVGWSPPPPPPVEQLRPPGLPITEPKIGESSIWKTAF